MAGKVSEVKLDLTGNALQHFLRIWSWMDVHSVENISFGEASAEIFRIGMEACLKDMEDNGNGC